MGFINSAILQKTTLPAVMKSLDAAMLRSRVIGNNIANATTPGFRRLEVSFEEELSRALDKTRLRGARTSEGHLHIGRKDLSRVDPQLKRPVDHTLPSGVNNVDIDMEMAALAENQIMFNYGVKFAQGTYRRINAAIQAKPTPIQ